jgi:hypothetical protein
MMTPSTTALLTHDHLADLLADEIETRYSL